MDVRVPLGDAALDGSLTVPTRAPRGAVVLLHGLASTRAEFADAGERLAAKGWVALALDARAHGAAACLDGTFRAEAVVEDLAAAAQFLRDEKHWAGPVGLVAHSMGAALACRALPRLRQYGAAALVAPADTVRGEISALEYAGYVAADAASRLVARLGGKPLRVPYKVDYADLFDDPEAAERAKKAPYLGRHVSLACYAELMGVSGAAWAAEVRAPTLVVVARNDRVVKRASSQRVYDALGGPKKLVELDSGHSAFGDRRAEDLSLLIDAWFREHLGR